MASEAIVGELATRVCATIDDAGDELIRLAREIAAAPELGYHEHGTAALVRDQLARNRISHREGIAITGVKARLSGGRSRATFAIFGELDALLLPEHPDATADGVVHACGHHVQAAAMVGAGIGLRAVMDQLDGDVVLFAVPAEEHIDLERRIALREQGAIEYLTGKAELIRLGELDDVDLAVVTHTANGTSQREHANVAASLNGAVLKRARFSGRAAHAGANPQDGINALKAATIGSLALDALRSTFPDGESVRVQDVLSAPGATLTTIPAAATVEAMIRARSLDALDAVCAAFDRAMGAGALATGAELSLATSLAYVPQENDPLLAEVARQAFAHVLGEQQVSAEPVHIGASSDMGDVGYLMPVVQPRINGVEGDPHTPGYRVADYELAVLGSAKAMAVMAVELLSDGASLARATMARRPRRTREDYLALRARFEGNQLATTT